MKALSPNHWTAKEFPKIHLNTWCRACIFSPRFKIFKQYYNIIDGSAENVIETTVCESCIKQMGYCYHHLEVGFST